MSISERQKLDDVPVEQMFTGVKYENLFSWLTFKVHVSKILSTGMLQLSAALDNQRSMKGVSEKGSSKSWHCQKGEGGSDPCHDLLVDFIKCSKANLSS